MILDKIDENRLLIALSSEDLKFLDVSINRLNWKYEFSSEIINPKSVFFAATKSS